MIAGMRKWLSRQAHNLNHVGSNPTPAHTIFDSGLVKKKSVSHIEYSLGLFYFCDVITEHFFVFFSSRKNHKKRAKRKKKKNQVFLFSLKKVTSKKKNSLKIKEKLV